MSMLTDIIGASRRRGGAGGPFDLAYYHFDAQNSGSITDTGGSPNLLTDWDSIAVGVNALTRTLSQATTADQPHTDGTHVRFNDTSDHLDFDTNVTQAGWVVVGTSLGTFSFRVNANAWAALSLFGSDVGNRRVGDLYGIALLPSAATAAEINAIRDVFIANGAADAVVGTSIVQWFQNRTDIVEVGLVGTSGITTWNGAFQTCSNLTTMALLNMSGGTSFQNTFLNCGLTTVPAFNMSNGGSFSGCFRSNAFVTFPSGPNMSNATTFVDCWRSNTLMQNFPTGFFDSWAGTPANSCFANTWLGCSALTATSVENIFNSIDTSGRSAPGGTAAQRTIRVDYDVATGTPSMATAITNLKARSWVPNLNGTNL